MPASPCISIRLRDRTAAPLRKKKTRADKRRDAEIRRQLAALTGPLRSRLEELEKRIEEAERKLRLVEFEMAAPSTYRNPQKAKGAAEVQAKLKSRIADMTGEWEQLSEQIDTAESRFRQQHGVAR